MSNITSTIVPNNTLVSSLSGAQTLNSLSTNVGATTLSQLTDVDLQEVTNGSLLIYDTNEFVSRTLTGAISVNANGQTSVNSNAITLGTHTTGSYVATVSGTANQIIATGSGAENANISLSLPQSIALTSSPTFADITISGAITNAALTSALDGKQPVGNYATGGGTATGNNTGDQDLSGLVPKTTTVNGKTLNSNISLNKGDVGLSAVDNTSDVGKPLSTAAVTALGLKANLANPTFQGTVNIPTCNVTFLQSYGTDVTFSYGAGSASEHRYALGLGTLATQSGTFSGTSSGTNTGDQTISLSGDVIGSGTSSFTTTLKNVGTAGTYNSSSTSIQPFTTDAAGRISAVGNAITITPSWSNVTNTPTTIAGYGITDAVQTNGNQNVDGIKTFTESPHVPNLTANSSSTSVVNKAYADNIAAGIHVHGEAHIILKTVTLAAATGGTVAYTNGTNGVGAKLTVTGGSTVLDALIALDSDIVIGSRVIIANETNAAHNGIYTVTAARELTRATDADSPAKMNGGDFVFVTHGTTYTNTSWIVSDPVVTVGISPVVFLQFSGAGAYDAGTGLTRDGTTFSITNTGVNATSTTYGSSTAIPILTVNPQGQITVASTASVSAAVTVDTNIIDGSGNAVSGNAVFDALALKAPLSSPSFTGTVSGVTSSMVGLGNVDNTSDANKPVSTAQQTALDLKANLASATFTGAISATNLSGTNTGDQNLTGLVPYTGATADVNLGSRALAAGTITSNGNALATVVDPVRTTLTGNGVLSSFAISGAGSLSNPSALIVAIDGALQEPTVDYGVGSGVITFTSPLASGAKAVVISPTNTLQVTQMIPADGSVTSTKLANDISISGTLGVVGKLTASGQPSIGALTDNDVMTRLLAAYEGVINGNEFRQMVGVASQAVGTGSSGGVNSTLGIQATVTTALSGSASAYTFDGVNTHSGFSGAIMRSNVLTEAFFHGCMFRVEANVNFVLRINFGVGGATRVPPAAGVAAASARQWGVEFYYNGTDYVGRMYWYDTSMVYGTPFIIPNLTTANWSGMVYSIRMRQTSTGLLEFYINSPTSGLGGGRLSDTPIATMQATWTSNFYGGRHINFEAANGTAAAGTNTRIHCSTMFCRI